MRYEGETRGIWVRATLPRVLRDEEGKDEAKDEGGVPMMGGGGGGDPGWVPSMSKSAPGAEEDSYDDMGVMGLSFWLIGILVVLCVIGMMVWDAVRALKWYHWMSVIVVLALALREWGWP